MKKFIQAHLSTILRLAPWLLLLSVVILFQYVLFLNVSAIKKEGFHAINMTKDRGAAIMHSFEATLFASRGFTEEEMQHLLIEQSNRPDIHFIAILDETGKVITSNDTLLIDTNLSEYIDRTENSGEISGKTFDFQLNNEEKRKMYIVGKQLFISPYFEAHKQEMTDFTDRQKNRFEPRNRNHNAPLDTNIESRLNENPTQTHNHPHNLHHNPAHPPQIPPFHLDYPPNYPAELIALQEARIWNPRSRFIRENPLFMLVSFDMREIRNAQLQDSAVGKTYTVGTIVLLVLSIFSFIVLRAYQRSYRLAQQSKDYILSLMNALPLGIIATDENKVIHTMNKSAEQFTKEEEKETIGKNIITLIPQLANCDLEKLKNKSITFHTHTDQPISLEVNTFPIIDTQNLGNKSKQGMGLILRDLREIQKLQEEVHRQERLASVGRLAAGIAHEIRNPLGTIKGIARLFEEKALRAQELQETRDIQNLEIETSSTKNTKKAPQNTDVKLASIMTQEITRVDKVISDLLELSKPNTINPKITDLYELVEKAKNSVFQISEEITFIENIDSNCTTAFLDEDRMLQVLHNVFLNAIQAMDKKGNIKISISEHNKKLGKETIHSSITTQLQHHTLQEYNATDEKSTDENIIASNIQDNNSLSNIAKQSLSNGITIDTKTKQEKVPIPSKEVLETNEQINNKIPDRFLEINITDTGKGIAKENIKNLFTPYYTSKAQGTGLGLVMVQKIVEAHNGTVHIESESGKGCSVIIRLAQ